MKATKRSTRTATRRTHLKAVAASSKKAPATKAAPATDEAMTKVLARFKAGTPLHLLAEELKVKRDTLWHRLWNIAGSVTAWAAVMKEHKANRPATVKVEKAAPAKKAKKAARPLAHKRQPAKARKTA